MRACLYIWSVARTLHFAKIKVRSKMTNKIKPLKYEDLEVGNYYYILELYESIDGYDRIECMPKSFTNERKLISKNLTNEKELKMVNFEESCGQKFNFVLQDNIFKSLSRKHMNQDLDAYFFESFNDVLSFQNLI